LRATRIPLAVAALLSATAICGAPAYGAADGDGSAAEAVATTAGASSVNPAPASPGASVQASQSAVASASAHGSTSSATATASSTSSVSQSSSGTDSSTHVQQTATATATATGSSTGDGKSGDAVAVARNVSQKDPSNQQPSNVVQTATATAQSGPSTDGKSSDSIAIATNVSEIGPSSEQSANVVQTANATSPAGGDGTPAVAMNVSKIGQSGPAPSSSGDGSADVCNGTDGASTCTQTNAANVNQTAIANGAGSLALNVADIKHSDQVASGDLGAGSTGGDGSNSTAGVCNAGGPAANCTQEHVVNVSQTAVADGLGAVAVNNADVTTLNQIAGRDAGVGSTAGSDSSNSAAGVCNAGGPAANCTQKSTVTLTQVSLADGDGATVMSDADVLSVNQIGGRDAGFGSTGGDSANANSAAGVCNAGGPAVNCTQTNNVAVEQRTSAVGDGATATSELGLSAVNQITGRDAGVGTTGGGNQNVNSAAGVCNVGGPTIANCTQDNSLSVEWSTSAAGDGSAAAGEFEVGAANQIAGRDAGVGAGTNVAAVNQITGRDAGAGSTGGTNQGSSAGGVCSEEVHTAGCSAAGVCNAGGENTVNCTQKNTLTVASTGNETDVAAANQIAGRDAGTGSTGAANQDSTSAAGVCNAGGPTVNCTQENTVDVAANGEPMDVAAVNQIAGRDAGAGAGAAADNQATSSAAGVCNAGGQVVNCTQQNTISGAATGETDAAAVNQIAGRDAVAGPAPGGTQGGESSADVCNSDSASAGCGQENHVALGRGRVTAVKQIAGRTKNLRSLLKIWGRAR
jgi:hypothetical protein